MRRLVFTIFLLALPSALFGQAGQADSEAAVRRALAQATRGEYTSTTEKELERLGDSTAVALTKIVAGRALNEADVEPIVLIVTLSYGDPRIVGNDSDREPRTTLFLLKCLDASTRDARLKGRIADTQALVQDRYEKFVRQGRVGLPTVP